MDGLLELNNIKKTAHSVLMFKAVFEAYNKNKTGLMNMEEFKIFVKDWAKSIQFDSNLLDEQDISALFQMIDNDRSGMLSFYKFSNWFTQFAEQKIKLLL